jgi:hypothetical protein
MCLYILKFTHHKRPHFARTATKTGRQNWAQGVHFEFLGTSQVRAGYLASTNPKFRFSHFVGYYHPEVAAAWFKIGWFFSIDVPVGVSGVPRGCGLGTLQVQIQNFDFPKLSATAIRSRLLKKKVGSNFEGGYVA